MPSTLEEGYEANGDLGTLSCNRCVEVKDRTFLKVLTQRITWCFSVTFVVSGVSVVRTLDFLARWFGLQLAWLGILSSVCLTEDKISHSCSRLQGAPNEYCREL